ncbi:hypothetical protein BJV74DRAFT_882932 [Russula compacta]|nr:hypothetical protein BJV74DRAFT_882932 [Russula compacta]
MTNWQSPVVQLADALTLIKFIHGVAGVYIWEFVLNLHFDYSVIMRKRVARFSSGQWVGTFCEGRQFLQIRLPIFSTFITDLVLLMLMFIGILRWQGARESGSIWWTLYTQGLAWVVVFTLAEVPPVVFIILNLNYPMDRMFMIPGITIMSIGATRIYLGLINSATFNNYPVKAVVIKKWATETPIRFHVPSSQSYLADDTLRMDPSQKA